MNAPEQITRQGVITALYLCPMPDSWVRAASLLKLAEYVDNVHALVPRHRMAELEHGLRHVVEQGGPHFDRARYALAQSRADAVAAMQLDVDAVHPIELDPEHCHPN